MRQTKDDEILRILQGGPGSTDALVSLATRQLQAKKWQAYNESQTEEKLWFLDLLADLTQQIEWQPRGGKGRPQANLPEMVFSCVSKVYEGLSSRRATSDLELAHRRGYLSKVPHFNTVLKFLNEPELTPVFTKLIEISALPLKPFESTFAIDASGLSSAFYSRWLDYRFNDDRRFHDWIKVHLMCGVKTHIVTAVTVTDGHTHDSPQFPTLLGITKKRFNVDAVCADLGYSSRKNVQAAWDSGIAPLIPFKSSATGKSLGSKAWTKMYHWFKMNQEDFYKRYHARSNVESTFSALKRKFGTKLMTKKEVAQTNEALCKVLCHNLTVLTFESHWNNFKIDFEKAQDESLHTKSDDCT
ncbi:MAG: transposase [Candidatus Norongarragalinales archaeon]